jgi:hypothetical protein
MINTFESAVNELSNGKIKVSKYRGKTLRRKI